MAGQHLNNVVIYMPYFYKGELLMFLMVRAHWIDVGGTSTGFGAGATVADPWLEGLQLDQLKIYEEGKLDEPLYRVIKDNIRFPESSLGDMKSQMAACRLAGRRLDELFDKYGRDTLLAAIDQIFDETERKCRNVVAQLPDGVYEASASIDDDGVIKGEEVPIHVKVTVKSGDMIIDLSGCSAERKAAINSRTYAGARVAYKALTGPLDPVNEGSFRALEVIIPEGNIMMARFPAPMAGWSGIVPTVVDCHRQGAGRRDAGPRAGRTPRAARRRRGVLRHASQDQAPLRGAEHRGRRLGRPAVRGRRVRHGVGLPGRRAQRLDRGHRAEMPGGGARAARCGTDSCGAGKFRGGLGIDMQVKNLVEGKWNFEMPRRSKCPPWGIRGGTPGEPGGYLLKLPGERKFTMRGGSHIPVPVGAEAIVRTGGGGGWGKPLDREPSRGRAGCRRGLHLGGGGAQALRRGGPRQHVAR